MYVIGHVVHVGGDVSTLTFPVPHVSLKPLNHYWWSSSSLTVQDYELVRIWDSLTFEDDVEDELALSLCASGSLSENQTRQALHLVWEATLWLQVPPMPFQAFWILQAHPNMSSEGSWSPRDI